MIESNPARTKKKITYTASTQGIERAGNALKRLGFESKSSFAESQILGRNTVTKFFQRQPIQLDSFKKICQALRLNWAEIVERIEEEQSERLKINSYSTKDTDKGVEPLQTLNDLSQTVKEISCESIKDVCDIKQSMNSLDAEFVTQEKKSTGAERLGYAIAGSVERVNVLKLKAIVALIQEITGDTSIKIVDIEKGSLKLVLEGSQEGLERLESLFKLGQLKEVLGIYIEDIKFLAYENLDNGRDIKIVNKNRLLFTISENVSEAELAIFKAEFANALGNDEDIKSNSNYSISDKVITHKSVVTNINAYYNRGNDLRDLGDEKGAIENYNQAIKLNPSYTDAYKKRGHARSQLGDKSGAIDDYKQAIKLNPNDFYIYNSFIHDDLGDKSGAIKECNQAIKLNPHLAENYIHRGNIRWQLGDKKGAIEDYNQAIKLNPDYARVYNNRGHARSQLGDASGAIEDYNQAIKLNHNFIYAYINRGDIRNVLGDKKGAIEDYNQAIKLNPNYAPAYYSRAFPRNKLGDISGAIEDCSQAIKLDPNYASAYSLRAAIRLDMGDNGAIEDCNQAIKLDPNYAIDYYMRGDIRNKLGDISGAIEDCSQAIKLDPNYASAYSLRAAIRLDMGDKKGAIEDCSQAIKLDPNYAIDYYMRGDIRNKLGDISGAIEDFQTAANIYQNLGNIKYYNLALEKIKKVQLGNLGDGFGFGVLK